MKIQNNKIRKPIPELSEFLRTGRRALDVLSSVEILEDFSWNGLLEKWVLHLRLTPEKLKVNSFVPITTEWYVLLSPKYPYGKIKFKPAKENGLIYTFPHQTINLLNEAKDHWRTGDLCLDKPGSHFGRQGFTKEPMHADLRLFWHVQRALSWLEDAAENRLFKFGDPFELPQFVFNSPSMEKVVFAESKNSFEHWINLGVNSGVVEFYKFGNIHKTYPIKGFFQIGSDITVSPVWGYGITGKESKANAPIRGIWLKLKELPIVPPWQAPITWGELNDVCLSQGIDLHENLNYIYSHPKIGESIGNLLLIGFPIPSKVGADFERFHWQAIKLPEINRKSHLKKIIKSSHQKDLLISLSRGLQLKSDLKIEWLTSENWYPDQIRSRGTFPIEFSSKNILLIGNGSLGSMIGELLVRGGVDRMVVNDFDFLKVGNLIRHTLDLRDLGFNKADSLAHRLNNISPFAQIDEIEESFLNLSQNSIERIRDCNLIIDCTGDDSILQELSEMDFESEVIYVSASTNLGAKRLYLYMYKGNRYNFIDFREKITPWLELDLLERQDIEMPLEGIGCWHPVFPGRADDMSILASVVVKRIIELLANTPIISELEVFEQNISDKDGFIGIKKAVLTHKNIQQNEKAA